jgi:hypothetical protein
VKLLFEQATHQQVIQLVLMISIGGIDIVPTPDVFHTLELVLDNRGEANLLLQNEPENLTANLWWVILGVELQSRSSPL